MHDGLHYGQPELITPQMEKNVGKARTARSRSGAALWLSRAVMRVSRLWGGLDTLVFMAGIGENLRRFAAICEHLEFLGIRLFPRDERNAAIISRAASPVTVRVMTTSEELMIAGRPAISCAIKKELFMKSTKEPIVSKPTEATRISDDRLRQLDRYWRAANYLTIDQIYLQENPLLCVEHIKPRLLGRWGTSPGLSFIYAHLNRLIQDTGAKVIWRRAADPPSELLQDFRAHRAGPGKGTS